YVVVSMHLFFFFIVPAATEIYTLSLHDALPILSGCARRWGERPLGRSLLGVVASTVALTARAGRGRSGSRLGGQTGWAAAGGRRDRKSTRLNSSHVAISYAVFCLKKKITKRRGA